MDTTTARIGVASLTLIAIVAVGCAKRPALVTASAPAPSAAARSAEPSISPPMVAAAPATPAPPEAEKAQPAPAPAPPAAQRPEPRDFAAIPEVRDIHFDFDKSDIRPGDARILDANAEWLKSNANARVLIEGHCDERGTNAYNMALGDRRARSTMNYFLSRGISADRVTTISYGEERPLCTEHNESCWSQNRRAHFLVQLR